MSRCAFTEEDSKVHNSKAKDLIDPEHDPPETRRTCRLKIPPNGKGLKTNHQLVLIVRDGQEDAVIHRDGMRKQGRSLRPGHGHMRGLAAECGTRRTPVRPGTVTGLERNAGGLRCAV